MSREKICLLAALIVSFVATGMARAQGGNEQLRTVFLDVSVLSMTTPEVVTDRAVIIQGDAIVAITERANYEQTKGDQVIDGKGGVLIPGLIDAHVHIDHPQDLGMLPLYGVTTAVNMRGLPWHLRARQTIREGRRFSADFITSGDYVDGYPPDMLPMTSVDGVAAARRAVIAQHSAGFDFIKVYSELSREQYLAVCDQARQLGIGVAGHIPDAVSIEDLTACPHANVAHGEQLFKVLGSRQDSEIIAADLEALSQASVTVTGNISLYLENAKQPFDLDQLIDRPEAKLIHPATFQPFRPGINRYARRDEAWAERVTEVAKDVQAISRLAENVDSSMLVAGSDMPVAGAYPGISLLQEIESYAAAGLSPFQALSTATINAARLIHRLDPDFPSIGAIVVGARADLVLLESNPLADLQVLRSPQGVMLRGAWYDKAQLAAISESLIASNADAATRVESLESAVFAGNLEAARQLFTFYRQHSPEEILFAQYPYFFFGFSLLYGDEGLTDDPEQAQKAVLLYDMYQQTYPEFHSAHHVYGLALEAAGDKPGALAAQKKAVSIHADYPPALKAIARLTAE